MNQLTFTNVGTSAETLDKQIIFERLIRNLVTIGVSASQKNLSYLIPNYYEYIDTNAGSGEYLMDEKRLVGSPIIANTILEQHGCHFSAALIEKNQKCADYLKSIDFMNYFSGQLSLFDQKIKAVTVLNKSHSDAVLDVIDFLKKQRHQIRSSNRQVPLGLIYCDPNGIADLAFDFLIEMLQKDCSRLDILINYNAVAPKRCRAKGMDFSLLADLLDKLTTCDHSLRFFISAPRGKWQWTFIFGTRTDKLNQMLNYFDFLSIKDKEGQSRLFAVDHTKKELQALGR